jgi:hypothetical protein
MQRLWRTPILAVFLFNILFISSISVQVINGEQNLSAPQPNSTASSPCAVILNPSEYVYGHRQCQTIINILMQHHYNIEYKANDAVTISYLRYNLTADVVYMNTHAGYFDLDGDQRPDAVVIATGEHWTNETPQIYAFEYQHKMIVKGMVGDTGFIAFTPAFIAYYYPPGSLSNSLIYMATCYASYDSTMAQAFLNASAEAYIGWTQNTVFWTNSKTSVESFRLLASGRTVEFVCHHIRYGGFYNWLFHSKLVFYGNGAYRIPH